MEICYYQRVMQMFNLILFCGYRYLLLILNISYLYYDVRLTSYNKILFSAKNSSEFLYHNLYYYLRYIVAASLFASNIGNIFSYAFLLSIP